MAHFFAVDVVVELFFFTVVFFAAVELPVVEVFLAPVDAVGGVVFDVLDADVEDEGGFLACIGGMPSEIVLNLRRDAGAMSFDLLRRMVGDFAARGQPLLRAARAAAGSVYIGSVDENEK